MYVKLCDRKTLRELDFSLVFWGPCFVELGTAGGRTEASTVGTNGRVQECQWYFPVLVWYRLFFYINRVSIMWISPF